MCMKNFPPGAASGDALEQSPIVAHVLEHFQRHDAVETVSSVAKIVHVGGNHGDVFQAPCARPRPRCMRAGWRVGHRGDLRLRVVRAIHSVSEPQPQPSSSIRIPSSIAGPLAGRRQRIVFGLLQRLLALPASSSCCTCDCRRAPRQRTPPVPRNAVRWPFPGSALPGTHPSSR